MRFLFEGKDSTIDQINNHFMIARCFSETSQESSYIIVSDSDRFSHVLEKNPTGERFC